MRRAPSVGIAGRSRSGDARPRGATVEGSSAPLALRLRAAALFCALLLLAVRPAAALGSQPNPAVVGGDFSYSVRRGDSLAIVSARFGVDAPVLAADNGLAPDARLRIGQTLRVINRHIVPGRPSEGLRINIPQRMLFEYDGDSVRAYPVGLGRPDWQTPTGRFAIAGKDRHPSGTSRYRSRRDAAGGQTSSRASASRAEQPAGRLLDRTDRFGVRDP